jgi:small-conductance mechanosensitive channel
MESESASLFSLLGQYRLHLFLSVLIIALYFFLHGRVIPRLENYVEKGALKNQALKKAVYLFRMLYGIVSLALVLFIWGFDFDWLIAISSGIIALTGVALFASWSFLSNITAFFILLIHDSYKRGTFIRIIEADNYVEGYISEINIFNTRLITENREYIIYPNNLLIARPTVINPKARFSTIGKIQEFSPQKDPAGDKNNAPGS